MARKQAVKHIRVEQSAIQASVKADNAERGIKDGTERGQAIVGRIRERYSIQEECAILRKAINKLAHGQQPDQEFFDYNEFVEAAKVEVDNQENHQ